MTESTPVTRHLDSLGVPYRLFRHAGPVESLEQAARERGQAPGQVIRSIVFSTADGGYVMVLMGGARRVSWRDLRRHLGQSRLTTAAEAELLDATGYQIGAVSPFGLVSPVRILVDASALEHDDISIGSGERGLTVILRSADLRAALPHAEVGTFGLGP